MAHPRDFKALKSKTPQDDESDKLSALPDEILCHILSFLPTETAAATSVLSTRWKDLFISLPVIDLTISKSWDAMIGEERRRGLCKFQNFIFRLIFLRNKAPIRKFQLSVSLPLVEGLREGIFWLISKVLLHQVQELDICEIRDAGHNRLYWPEIFTSATLSTLTMTMKSDVNFILPNSVSLPNIKVLRLDGFILTDQDPFARVIKGCPLLEELFLRWAILKNEDVDLHVSAPLLKKLALSCYRGRYSLTVESNNLEYLDCTVYGVLKFVINAPYLKYFKYQGYPVRAEFVQDVRNIVNATIAFEHQHIQREFEGSLMWPCLQLLESGIAFELISGLQYAKSLRFQSGVKILCYAGQLLPTFINLGSLALDDSIFRNHYCFWGLNLITILLENAPNLKALDIVSSVFDYEFSVERLGIFLRAAFPARSIRHLEELKIILVDDQEFCLKLAEYFLEIGESLKKMILRGSIKGWESSPEVYTRITSFKKSSENCRIVLES